MKTIEDRLQVLEDQIAIYNVISAYGPAVDGCNVDDMDKIYAEEGVYDIRDMNFEMKGLSAIRGMMNDEDGHRSLVSTGAAHIGTIPHVEISGDRATATNYTLILRRKEGEPYIFRFGISRTYLSRKSEGWRIDRRIIEGLDGRQTARDLAAKLFEGPDKDSSGWRASE